MTDSPWNELELFISHASEDKAGLVRNLAQRLRHWGVKVWYDEYSLSPGDSLSRSLDRGLAATRYGLVVISEHFLVKPWTEYELRGLTTKEVFRRDKVIIPVWHGVTAEDVAAFSPSLADKVAVVTDGKSIEEVAEAVIRAIRPDIAQRMSLFRALRHPPPDARTMTVPLDEIATVPAPRTFKTEGSIVIRAMLVTEVLSEPRGLAGTLDSFLTNLYRDVHPEPELRVWELIAAIFASVDLKYQLTPDERSSLLGLLLACSTSHDHILSYADELREPVAVYALTLWRRMHPISRLDEVECHCDEGGGVGFLLPENLREAFGD